MNNQKAVKYYEEATHLQQMGKLSAAERSYKKAIKINPDFVEAYNNLGNVLLTVGRLKEAFAAFSKAQKILPNHPMLLHNLGNVLQIQGDNQKAIAWYNKAIKFDPTFVGNYINQGNALRDVGQFEAARVSYQRAIDIDPSIADIYNNLGSVLIELDQLEDAVTNFKKAIEVDPNHSEAFNGLGNAYGYLAEVKSAITAYRKAIEISPRHKDAHNGLGNMLSDSGEIEAAISAFRLAIEINPDYADAHRSLSKLKKFTTLDDDDVRAMLSLYDKKGLREEQKMHLAYGLGKAHEDTGEYQNSMAYIIEGARLKRPTLDYSTAGTSDLFNRAKTVFSTEFFENTKNFGNSDKTPIFILGMPRSGTSLTEQILASHASVFGAGELKNLFTLSRSIVNDDSNISFPESVIGLEAEALTDLGREYCSNIRQHSEDALYITDKTPDNFLRIGFIKAILPNAKVICCTRDPMDNCLSLFKNYFVGAINYSYDMTELGQYYKLYTDLMDHWKRTLPGWIYDLSYEALVADPENQIKLLLDYCDLPWNDDCLNFHKTQRNVRTASNAQVRQPMYQNSIELWKRYEQQLQPLWSALYK